MDVLIIDSLLQIWRLLFEEVLTELRCVALNTKLFVFYHIINVFLIISSNPFTDKQLNLLGIVPKPVCHFGSLSVFCLGSKRYAGEQLALVGWLFCILNKTWKVNENGKLVRFCGVSKCCLSVKGLNILLNQESIDWFHKRGYLKSSAVDIIFSYQSRLCQMTAFFSSLNSSY